MERHKIAKATDPQDKQHEAITTALSGKATVRAMQETVQMKVLDIDEY